MILKVLWSLEKTQTKYFACGQTQFILGRCEHFCISWPGDQGLLMTMRVQMWAKFFYPHNYKLNISIYLLSLYFYPIR